MPHLVDRLSQPSPSRAARWGMLLALGMVAPWASGRPGLANAMQEPLSPGPSSLAPVEVEAFRERYGQEALFRLKLGVEAGEAAGHGRDMSGTVCSGGWAGSRQQQQFEGALQRKQWFDAGEILGGWRRQCSPGSAGAPPIKK